MSNGDKIAVIDDDANHRKMLCSLLEDWGYRPIEGEDGIAAIEISKQPEPPAAMLLDVRMARMDGLTALPEILAHAPDMPVILITAYSEVEAAVNAMRKGAWDYMAKPLDVAKVKMVLQNALSRFKRNEPRPSDFPLLGISSPMREVAKMVRTVGPADANVMITGESGTGKELAARALHDSSQRRGGPFVAINCGAFTESLLASELFGHEKGAFTGADKKHEGLFLKASGGTLFLDEVGEMPLPMQVRLLRVLQEREVLPVGANRATPINCRIIAATNRNLEEEVANGNFRSDLYYRLNVVGLPMPPLRERGEDIALLAQHFGENFAKLNKKSFLGITAPALRLLNTWHWPGNVRELENVMERAIILMPGEYVGERELPPQLRVGENHASQLDSSDNHVSSTLEEVEKRAIMQTLAKVHNNKTEAAKVLGISRKTLHSKLNRYKLDK